MSRPRYPWTRQQIRNARRAHLPDLLRHEGFALRETGGGNFELVERPGLIVKNNFWRWPQEGRQGNTIDLLVNVLGMSFDQAMRRIAPSQ